MVCDDRRGGGGRTPHHAGDGRGRGMAGVLGRGVGVRALFGDLHCRAENTRADRPAHSVPGDLEAEVPEVHGRTNGAVEPALFALAGVRLYWAAQIG